MWTKQLPASGALNHCQLRRLRGGALQDFKSTCFEPRTMIHIELSSHQQDDERRFLTHTSPARKAFAKTQKREGGLFGNTRQIKSMTKSTLNKFFWAKDKCWKKCFIFYCLCPRCTINSDWSETSERRLKSKFFKPSLDRLSSTSQKSIFKAVFSG